MNQAVEQFLASLPGEVEPIARALRTRIRELVPDAVEQQHGGWKVIGYSRDGSMKSTICAIAPHSKHVNLQFFRGTELKDPQGLLEGTGKNARHVKLRTSADVQSAAIGELIRQAASLTNEP